MRLPYTLRLAAFPFIASAQPQLENPSFESWTNAGQATQEPTDWSSLKTSDGGAIINGLVPQLCWRSTDAHTGNYSVNLRTVSSVAGTTNGLLTNGRVHAELQIANSYMFTDQGDGQWNTPLGGSRPDSLIGWFKASPQTGDRTNVGALLHVDEGRLPAFGTEANWVAGASWKAPFGNIPQWTRFSTPFQYLNGTAPEWVLLILTAGDSAGSQVGTQVWYDDLGLIYNVLATPDQDVVTLFGADADLQVDYTTGGTPVAATTFTVEMSDANGDFATPQVLGSFTSNLPSGAIACTVPASTPSGTYFIRVSAPSPYYAPVPTQITIDNATAVQEGEHVLFRCWLAQSSLCIEAPPGHDRYELLDVLGRRSAEGRLSPDGITQVPVVGAGLVLVRVSGNGAAVVQKVLVR